VPAEQGEEGIAAHISGAIILKMKVTRSHIAFNMLSIMLAPTWLEQTGWAIALTCLWWVVG
jgi:hypothetical protein